MQRIRNILKDNLIWFLFFYFSLLPILAIGLQGFLGAGEKENGMKILAMSLDYLANSLKVALVVTLLSTTLGLLVSFCVHRLPGGRRTILRGLLLMPLINPPFVGSIAYIMVFGKRGLITHELLGLSISPFGYTGIVVMQTLGLTTLAFILLGGALKKLNPDLEDAARNLGAGEGRVFKDITLPLMLPELTTTATLVFLASMSDFGTPLIIGGPYQTLASKIYLQITGLYDLNTAAFSGMILLIPCVLIFLAQKKLVARKKYYSHHIHRQDIRYRSLPRSIILIVNIVSWTFALFILFKYLFIVLGMFTVQWGYDYSFTLKHLKHMRDTNLVAFANSVQLAFFVAFFASTLGILLSYLIKRGRIRYAGAIDLMGTLPAAVPGILFGVGYLITFKYPLLGLGRLYLAEHKGIVLLGTGIILYIICIFRYTNVGLRAGYALLEHMSPDIEDAARNLGARETRLLRDIVVPLMLPAFETAFIKNYSTTMTTLGAIIFLILPANKVAIQQIFQMITSSQTGVAASMAVTLSLMTGTLMLLFTLLFKKIWKV